MVERRPKKLGIRLASNPLSYGAEQGGPGSFVNVLRWIHERRPSRLERRITYANKAVECRHSREVDGGLCLYLAAHVPSDQVALVPHLEDDIALLDPPEGNDFLDGDLFAFVKDNNVLFCTANLREQALASYAMQLGPLTGLPGAQLQTSLLKRLDVDKLGAILREGVASISIGAAAHAASIAEIQTDQSGWVRRRLVGGILEEISALVGWDFNEVPIDRDDVMVSVELRYDKRRGVEVAQEKLVELASAVVADQDRESGFEICTLQNNRIRSEDVLLSKTVNLPSYGKSVAYTDAWEALREYYAELAAQPGA